MGKTAMWAKKNPPYTLTIARSVALALAFALAFKPGHAGSMCFVPSVGVAHGALKFKLAEEHMSDMASKLITFTFTCVSLRRHIFWTSLP